MRGKADAGGDVNVVSISVMNHFLHILSDSFV